MFLTAEITLCLEFDRSQQSRKMRLPLIKLFSTAQSNAWLLPSWLERFGDSDRCHFEPRSTKRERKRNVGLPGGFQMSTPRADSFSRATSDPFWTHGRSTSRLHYNLTLWQISTDPIIYFRWHSFRAVSKRHLHWVAAVEKRTRGAERRVQGI